MFKNIDCTINNYHNKINGMMNIVKNNTNAYYTSSIIPNR